MVKENNRLKAENKTRNNRPTGPVDKDADKASFKEFYLTFRSLTDNPRHFEDKWRNIFMGVRWL